ncbi:glycosyl hydrolase [Sedimentisphaera salicampi]|uniref:glycosyl hydrolase n=1 Tax=Sedimentisphaera salicampi TaxID=1941349 RepID=UPI000B9B96FD|nr:glycosyl hydrolase [Sedimentisphaera salicampi]OXU14009.1 hypothetical protein SMSP1_02171 [Sedimentisphaera salicampi]
MKIISAALFLLSACTVSIFAEVRPAGIFCDHKANQRDNTAQPWARWWWLGNAVDEDNISDLLKEYSDSGIGGVEICPIYGAKGWEDKFVEFLSPRWVELLEYTLQKGEQYGIEVDLTTGTGWPFGGEMVTKDTASSGVILKRYTPKDGKISEKLPSEELIYISAVSAKGKRLDITGNADKGFLEWQAPEGSWEVYAVFMKRPVQRVKRAAPGGEGYVLNPYSTDAIKDYLKAFDKAFSELETYPNSFFHDSFEYYGADWTEDFFEEFTRRRGYDLREHIEALYGEAGSDIQNRVKYDYRKTLSELHIEVIEEWTRWCNSKGSLSRNQAHGAPANLIDLYAASDIPETEIFREVDFKQYPMIKLCSSAAHLKGGNLASSETFTWLNEHFQTSLNDLKPASDFLFLSGINHIFFHGIPYSPKEAKWPGWQFYASVNLGPQGGLWRNLPAYNSYAARCQAALQEGRPDSDILLYFPVHDLWNTGGKAYKTFGVHNQDEWLRHSSFYRLSMKLWEEGWTYDAVSDRFLQKAACENGKIIINSRQYDAVIIPECLYINLSTMQKLFELAEQGAEVMFQKHLPPRVPGLADKDKREAELRKILKEAIQSLKPYSYLPPANMVHKTGKGEIRAAIIDSLLNKSNLKRETFADKGIRFVRRSRDEGFNYFLVNLSDNNIDGWIELSKQAESVLLIDPLYEEKFGRAAIKKANGKTNVYIQLRPDQSIILKTFSSQKCGAGQWEYCEKTCKPIEIEGRWDVEFVSGGPALPEGEKIKALMSWTNFKDEQCRRFHGTARYSIRFDKPDIQADKWKLGLGEVCSSARIYLNGKLLGVVWAKPFVIDVNELKSEDNLLQVEVTNLPANRIRDLDKRDVDWKYFYNINVVDIDYEPFDASDWPIKKSGLLGPVVLTPQKIIDITR